MLADALVDESSGRDAFGRPRKLWNAVQGFVFVGVSSNEQEPAYNCYPCEPATALVDILQSRAERTVEQVLEEEPDDAP